MDKVEKIDKQIMDRVLDGSMTIKEMNAIQDKISQRCYYIGTTIIKMQGGSVVWWDFDNEGGHDGPQGYFDPEKYPRFVTYTGEFKSGLQDGLYYSLDGFPTKWIWEDFEDALKKEIEEMKQSRKEKAEKDKTNRIQRENKKKELIKSALAKLTPEERKELGY